MSDEKKKITYADIKAAFTPDDLARYNTLCTELIELTRGKQNAELWDMAQPGQKLRGVLEEIHAVREKYDFLKGERIFRVWTFNIKSKQREELIW